MALTVKHHYGIMNTIEWKVLLRLSIKVTRMLNFCNLREGDYDMLPRHV
jgi:hypothetical protein